MRDADLPNPGPLDRPAPPPELHGLDPGELLARGFNTVQPSGGAHGWVSPTAEDLSLLLPQYQVERLIGRGGMGAVYKGTQLTLDRPVAIKLLPAELALDTEFVVRFQREARTLARLQHSRIITIHDFGQTSEGHLYFVMEYIDGTDLRSILRGPGLNPEQALVVVGQLCDALQAAHREGVVHRDIKPENVLITRDGYVKLADFGLARPHAPDSTKLTSAGMIMGTPDYMAPEQRTGEGNADPRSDLFALGVMLYEMLTGQTPRGVFDPPSHKVKVDVRIDEVVLKALQSEPDRRYQKASEMKTDVERIRATPLPVPKPSRKIPAKKRAKTLAPVLAILGVCVGLGSYFFWLKSGQVSVLALTSAPPAKINSDQGTALIVGSDSIPATKDKPFVNSLGLAFVPAGIPDVLFATTDTRVLDFRAFVNATDYQATKATYTSGEGGWKQRGEGWRYPGAEQSEDYPVVCVSWADAKAFCHWLTKRDQASGLLRAEWEYRLPKDTEWDAAVAGTKYPWGDYFPPLPSDGQHYDVRGPFAKTAPVKSFKPNRYGLYDMSGNVWQWCEDGPPDQNYANEANPPRFLRGGSFSTPSDKSNRIFDQPPEGYDNRGFRCVLAAAGTAASENAPLAADLGKEGDTRKSEPQLAISSAPIPTTVPKISPPSPTLPPVPKPEAPPPAHGDPNEVHQTFAQTLTSYTWLMGAFLEIRFEKDGIARCHDAGNGEDSQGQWSSNSEGFSVHVSNLTDDLVSADFWFDKSLAGFSVWEYRFRNFGYGTRLTLGGQSAQRDPDQVRQALEQKLTSNRWLMADTLELRFQKDRTILCHNSSSGVNSQGTWHLENSEQTVHVLNVATNLMNATLLFNESFSEFVVSEYQFRKSYSGIRIAPETPPQTAYSTGFEPPDLREGMFWAGTQGSLRAKDAHWNLCANGNGADLPKLVGVQSRIALGRQALMIDAGATRVQAGISTLVENPGGPIVVNADVFLASSARQTPWQFAVSETGAGFVGGFNVAAEDGHLQLMTKGFPDTKPVVKRNVWKHYTLRLDTEKQTYCVLIDGQPVATEVPFLAKTKRIRVFQFDSFANGDDRAYFDNFTFEAPQ